MDAVEFVKTVNRLCKNLRCKECPVYKEGICTVGFDDYSVKSIEETVSKVEQWAKDHPVKTRQSEFLKMFPNAEFCRDVINILPCSIEKEMCKYCDNSKCEECRKDYWLAAVTDND
jgi:hypothetical protein